MGTPQLVAVDSDTYAFPQPVQDTLDLRIQTRLQQQYGYGAAKIDAFLSPDGTYEYEVITVHAPGKAMNATLEKVYNNNYEKTWTSGTFNPGTSAFGSYQGLAGGYVTISADGYQGGQVSGLQIKNGVLYRGWGNYSSDPRVGHEALALMKDGSWRTFSDSTSTPQQVVVAGTDTTFGFGPLVVVNGAVRGDLGDSSVWTDWVTSLSGRHLMGYNAAGDAIFILVKGTTGSSGIAGTEMGNVALRHGCVNAIMLDGGGSVQGRSSYLFHPSSDTGGNRDVSNVIAIKAHPMYPVNVDWTAVPYASGVTASNSNPLSVKKVNGEVRFRGTATVASVAANTWVTIGTLPPRFRPGFTTDSYRDTVFSVQGGYSGNVSISPTDGTIQVKLPVAASGTTYWQLDRVRYDAAY
ncbi:phosphodiester glycosidase family protein [Curtobacterium sp. L1-20]|uniref:phosphodiester glycosidase family protein n=1 Tax=Curtobacterium sp. L1-20 TaxID=3138181 RepID=UPI003B523A93